MTFDHRDPGTPEAVWARAPRLHAARPHQGQAATARNVLRLLEGSLRCTESARHTVFPDEARAPGTAPPPRVQDVYSLRCAPQVHGPVREALAYIGGIIGTAVAGKISDVIVKAMSRRNGGVYEPEFRLVMAVPVAIATAIGLMGYGFL